MACKLKCCSPLCVFLQVANETLHTDRPDLPQCFQLTVLSWLPCIYLWAVSPIYLFYLKRNNRGYIMMSIKNRFKTVRGDFIHFFIFMHIMHFNVYFNTTFYTKYKMQCVTKYTFSCLNSSWKKPLITIKDNINSLKYFQKTCAYSKCY